MSKEDKHKFNFTIGADLYDDNNSLKKTEIIVEADNEEEAFTKFNFTIGADLYDDNNSLKKTEIIVEADNEEEAFTKFNEQIKKIHNGKFHYNGLLKITKL